MLYNTLLTLLAVTSSFQLSTANPINPRGEGITVKFHMKENTAFGYSDEPDQTLWGSRDETWAKVAWTDEEAESIPEDEYAYKNFTLKFLKTATTVSQYDLKCQARINSEYEGGKRYTVKWDFPKKMKDDSGNDDKLAIACPDLDCHIDNCDDKATWDF
ncbi:uncharacterized protein L199_001146 [Kwoniella botswanensis]|uniref:uncharacterized protein n=1 Tax=Kwoniella botswanensis TaxID=1268659 RepID=UPI00315CDA85